MKSIRRQLTLNLLTGFGLLLVCSMTAIYFLTRLALLKEFDASLRANLDQANASHRQGFVRAMAHLITMCDGSCVLGADWDPWSATEAAFAAPTDASAVIRRASGASH